MRFELNFIRHKLIFMNHLTNVEIEYKNNSIRTVIQISRQKISKSNIVILIFLQIYIV